ncbi:MAG: hypothetical protein KBB39_17480 [Phycicoccus sp.]|nr:hypothetical protein [Phycicoccus sp.]
MNTTSTPRVEPISIFNKVLFPLLAAGALLAFVRGLAGLGIALAAGLAYVGVSIWRAQRGKDSVLTRVSAAQPYDEGDRAVMLRGFAWLGMGVFILQTIAVLVCLIFEIGSPVGEALRLLVVSLALGVANIVAVRAG